MGAAGRPLTKAPYPTERRPDHPLAHADGRVRIHQATLYDKIGPGKHACHRCGKVVEWQGKPRLVVDHLDGDTWNNDLNNLAPACSRCNSARHILDATHCQRGHEWNRENTYWRKKPNGRRTRQCKACQKIRDQKLKDRGYVPNRPTTYDPKRLGLNPAGLTLAGLREWLKEHENMPPDVHIYITRKRAK